MKFGRGKKEIKGSHLLGLRLREAQNWEIEGKFLRT
jgi:hypothetical protein